MHALDLDVDLSPNDMEEDGLFVGDPVVIKLAQARHWQQRLAVADQSTPDKKQHRQLLRGSDGQVLRPSDPIRLIHARAPANTSSELAGEEEQRAKQSATIALRKLSSVQASGPEGVSHQLNALLKEGQAAVAVQHRPAAREHDLMAVIVDQDESDIQPTKGSAEFAIRLGSLYFKSHPLFNDEQVSLVCERLFVHRSMHLHSCVCSSSRKQALMPFLIDLHVIFE